MYTLKGVDSVNRKPIISIVTGLVILVALVWLFFRMFTSPYSPNVVTYHVGRDSTWYPVDLRGKEKNMQGFANDLMQSIADDQGFRVQVFEVGRNALFDGLNTKKYDAVLSSLTPNVVNRKSYGFSDPFYLVGPVLVVPYESSVKSLEGMKGKILGVTSGSKHIYNIQDAPNVVVIPYDSVKVVLEKLDENIIDGAIVDALRAHVATDGYYFDRLKVATSPVSDRGIRLITRNDPGPLRFISQFNEGLAKMKANGVYYELVDKWGLINTEIKE